MLDKSRFAVIAVADFFFCVVGETFDVLFPPVFRAFWTNRIVFRIPFNFYLVDEVCRQRHYHFCHIPAVLKHRYSRSISCYTPHFFFLFLLVFLVVKILVVVPNGIIHDFLHYCQIIFPKLFEFFLRLLP